MRFLVSALVLAFTCGATALAQDDAAPSAATQIAHASHTLAAIWRPITTITQSALVTACTGAPDDLTALDAAIPDELTAHNLAAVHVAHGLAFVPSADPSNVYVFADPSMAWLVSGGAAITSADEDTGEVTLVEASGQTIRIILGHVAGQLLMRLTTPGGQDITFAGCTSTLGPAPAHSGDTPG